MISFLYYYYFHYQYYHYYYHIYYNSSSSSSGTSHSSIFAADSTWLNSVPDSEVRKITFGEHSYMRLTVTLRLITKPPSLPSPIAQLSSYLFKREAKVLKTNGDGLCLGLRLLSVFIQSVPPDILFHSWPSLCEESLCYITFTPFYKFFFVVETKQKQQHHQQYCKDE